MHTDVLTASHVCTKNFDDFLFILILGIRHIIIFISRSRNEEFQNEMKIRLNICYFMAYYDSD